MGQTGLAIGVVGAGTMGAGIAQVVCEAGHSVCLFDVAENQLACARTGIEDDLAKRVAKGRLSEAVQVEALARLRTTVNLRDLAACDLIVEAAPEDLALKHRLFAELGAHCRPNTVFASNTSSLSITAIAARVPNPERVVGLHFFNPAMRMPLVEVICGGATAIDTMSRAIAFAESLGKQVVVAADSPGFIVNRVARSFYGEALRLVGDHGAPYAAVDQAMTAVGGFKMGPFALMDLIGIDVNLAVSESVWESFYREPRFQPHPLQARMVAAGRLGRKAGIGFYPYPAGSAPMAGAAATPDAPRRLTSSLRLVLVGQATAVAAFAGRVSAAGHQVAILHDDQIPEGLDCDGALELGGADAEARLNRRLRLAAALPGQAWLASDDLAVSALEIAAVTGREVFRIGAWPGPTNEPHPALEVALPDGDAAWKARVAELTAALGFRPVVVPDLPGLVFPRTIATLVNEAAFAIEAGVADATAIDTAMKLGTGYPLGPLEWGDRLGPERIVSLLETLRATFGERYRPAPWLVRRARAGLPLADMGSLRGTGPLSPV